jgi:hypothetical protein
MAKRGGSSTVHGVLYQLLWSLLRTSEARILGSSLASNDGEEYSVTVTLEPEGGGGDLQINAPDAIAVEQIKSRGRNRTWSLSEIVEDVLPDLYIAARQPWPKRFRFITDGRIGEWTDVKQFFRSLAKRRIRRDLILSTLSSEPNLSTGATATSNWLSPMESERSIFEKIVTAVRRKAGVSQAESEKVTRRKLLKVLARFRVCESRNFRAIESRVDRLLSTCPIASNEIINTRRAMMTRLGELASQGGAVVDTRQFFAGFGVSDSFRNWLGYQLRADAVLRRRLTHRGYSEDQDVRREFAGFLARHLTHDRPVTVIHGLSGQGKSWLAFGLARWVAAHWRTLAIVISSKGSGDSDLLEAARVFSSEIANSDSHLPLDRIAAKLRPIVATDGKPLLLVVVDNVPSTEELQQLLQAQWTEWNMRLVVTCEDAALPSSELLRRAGAIAIAAEDFSEGELQTYLQRHLGNQWHTISEEVRTTLRRPLFADLYVRTFSADWQPTNEYMLLEARYQSLLLNHSYPFDSFLLEKLGEHLVLGGAYPCSAETMIALGFDEAKISRLMRNGWLRRSQEYFEMGHDRLLNWIVARVLWTQIRNKPNSTALGSMVNWVQTLIRNDGKHGGARLGYVPIDLLWMLCCEDESGGVRPATYLEGLEVVGWRFADSLYKEHVATIGTRVVPALFLRLKANKRSQQSPHAICSAISSFPWEEIKGGVDELLVASDLEERLLAADILKECLATDVLDKLWGIQLSILTHPEQFDLVEEQLTAANISARLPLLRNSWLLASAKLICEYCLWVIRGRKSPKPKGPKDSIVLDGLHRRKQDALRRVEAALCACVKIDEDWLVRQVERRSDEPHQWRMLSHLAWHAKLPPEKWLRIRDSLLANVADNQVFLLARCIDVARDYLSLPWLKSKLDSTNSGTIAAVLDTLAHLAPDDAVVCLRAIRPENLSIFNNRFWLSELFARREKDTLVALREVMSKDGVWPLAGNLLWYQECIDDPAFVMILNDLPRLVAEAIEAPDPDAKRYLYDCLMLLGHCRTQSQLSILRQTAGTDIEAKLVSLFEKIGPRASRGNDSHVRAPLVRVLQRIGASGFSEVVNHMLLAPTRWGRYDGLALAAIRFDEETMTGLRKVAEIESLEDGHAVEQNDAAEHLARWSDWNAVLHTVHGVDGQVFRDLGDCGLPPCPCTNELVRRTCERIIDDPTQATSGDIRLLGFAQNSVHYGIVLKVLESVSTQSEVAFSCVLALANLNCTAPEAVPAITRVHEIRTNQDVTARLLLDIGTDTAMNAVRKGLESEFLPITALNYLNQGGIDPEVVQWAIIYFLNEWWGSGIMYLEIWVQSARDPTVVKEILEVREIQDNLRREAFSRGSRWRPESICCLAFVDSDAAYLAAEAAMVNVEAQDRDRYPALMMEISREKAVPQLISIFVNERSFLLRRAITDAFQSKIEFQHLLNELNSVDVHRRNHSPPSEAFGR